MSFFIYLIFNGSVIFKNYYIFSWILYILKLKKRFSSSILYLLSLLISSMAVVRGCYHTTTTKPTTTCISNPHFHWSSVSLFHLVIKVLSLTTPFIQKPSLFFFFLHIRLNPQVQLRNWMIFTSHIFLPKFHQNPSLVFPPPQIAPHPNQFPPYLLPQISPKPISCFSYGLELGVGCLLRAVGLTW